MKPPKGPVRQLVGAASNSYGVWKFAKNKEAAIEFLKHYADNWVDAFKASTGYNMPIFANIVPKPMPILCERPDLAPARQAGDSADLGRMVRRRRLPRPRLGGDRRGVQRLCHLRHDDQGGDRRDDPGRSGQMGDATRPN